MVVENIFKVTNVTKLIIRIESQNDAVSNFGVGFSPGRSRFKHLLGHDVSLGQRNVSHRLVAKTKGGIVYIILGCLAERWY